MVKQGDIIWLDFDPQAGHEQRGRRPALIVSNQSFNNFSKLAIVCPITSRDKDHPFHIKLDDRTKTSGVILCDQAVATCFLSAGGQVPRPAATPSESRRRITSLSPNSGREPPRCSVQIGKKNHRACLKICVNALWKDNYLYQNKLYRYTKKFDRLEAWARLIIGDAAY
jgi:hypothetical protein